MTLYLAPTKKEALKAYQRFLDLSAAKYPKACECLRKDEDVLFKRRRPVPWTPGKGQDKGDAGEGAKGKGKKGKE